MLLFTIELFNMDRNIVCKTILSLLTYLFIIQTSLFSIYHVLFTILRTEDIAVRQSANKVTSLLYLSVWKTDINGVNK